MNQQKIAETGAEVVSIHSRVVSILNDAGACRNVSTIRPAVEG